MKYFMIALTALTLSGCGLLKEQAEDAVPYVAPVAANQYEAYCRAVDLEIRRIFFDEFTLELDKINPDRVAPKFDCNDNGIPDLDE